MRALGAAILVPVLLLSAVDASGQTIASSRPLSRRDLIRVVPECAHAGLIRSPACRKAADILDSTPERATQIYLNEWKHVAFRGHIDDPNAESHHGGGGGGSGIGSPSFSGLGNVGSCGNNAGEAFVAIVVIVVAVVVVVVAVALIVQGVKALHRAEHDARVRASDRITTRALRAVYRQSAGDPYADTMLDALSDSSYRSQSSWLRFSEIDRSVAGGP